ncbi:cyclin B like [Cryptosporidium canis]|uniref:Cyclin B like n=1 Tax=Cryptosporidium canis TaxID=195482 RepID=A0ABQ8P6K0_9CRYT|nr:cyclin B like [Cryptosporidium canis]
MTTLFGRFKEIDLFKQILRQISRYLESSSGGKGEADKFVCEIKKKYQHFNIEVEKENDYVAMNNLSFLPKIFEYANNFERCEYQEPNPDIKVEFDIGQIVTNRILSKQNEYNIKKVYTFYRGCYKNPIDFDKTLIDLRRELIGQMSDIIWEYHLNEEILFLTVHFLDNIVSIGNIRGKNAVEKLRYLGFTCLYITIKIDRVLNLNFKDIIKKQSLNFAKLLDMEKYVLSQLTFKLNPVSPLFILQFLMGILFESYLKEIIGINHTSYMEMQLKNMDCNKKDLLDEYNQHTKCCNSKIADNKNKMKDCSSLIINVLNMKSNQETNKALEYYISCYLLEISLYDIEILKYSPLCQAISVLLIAKECLGAGNESLEKYNFEKYLRRELIVEDYIKRNVNAIKRTLMYPYIKKTCTTKKYLTKKYMNAANYVFRFICSK